MRRVVVVLFAVAFALSLSPRWRGEEKKEIKFRTVTLTVEQEDARTEVLLKEGRIAKVVISGRFTATTEEGVMKAEKGEYDREEDKISAWGNILFYDERNRGTAKSIEVFLKDRKAVLKKNVRLVVRSKEREEKKEEGPGEAVISCDLITYWYREKRAVAEGGVAVEQERKRNGKKVAIRIAAEKGEYRREKKGEKEEEIISLEEKVRFEDSEGQYLSCKQLVYSLTEERMEVKGLTEARFKMKEEEGR